MSTKELPKRREERYFAYANVDQGAGLLKVDVKSSKWEKISHRNITTGWKLKRIKTLTIIVEVKEIIFCKAYPGAWYDCDYKVGERINVAGLAGIAPKDPMERLQKTLEDARKVMITSIFDIKG